MFVRKSRKQTNNLTINETSLHITSLHITTLPSILHSSQCSGNINNQEYPLYDYTHLTVTKVITSMDQLLPSKPKTSNVKRLWMTKPDGGMTLTSANSEGDMT